MNLELLKTKIIYHNGEFCVTNRFLGTNWTEEDLKKAIANGKLNKVYLNLYLNKLIIYKILKKICG